MNYRDVSAHIIQTTTTEVGDDEVTRFTRQCPCGWWTIAEDPEPDHHDPLVEREAAHLADVAAIVDRSVWQSVPLQHQLILQKQRWGPGFDGPSYLVVTAVWSGGFKTVDVFSRDVDGVAQAQETVAQVGAAGATVVWGQGAAREGWPVEPDELDRYVQ